MLPYVSVLMSISPSPQVNSVRLLGCRLGLEWVLSATHVRVVRSTASHASNSAEDDPMTMEYRHCTTASWPLNGCWASIDGSESGNKASQQVRKTASAKTGKPAFMQAISLSSSMRHYDWPTLFLIETRCPRKETSFRCQRPSCS